MIANIAITKKKTKDYYQNKRFYSNIDISNLSYISTLGCDMPILKAFCFNTKIATHTNHNKSHNKYI